MSSLQDINESLEYQPTEEDKETYDNNKEIGDPNFCMYMLPAGDCIVIPWTECWGQNEFQHFTEQGLVIARRVVITKTGWRYA